ncbi:MAG: VWA domain-containing protein [Bacteroidetes bacterium]|nr:VWA domain-containing protein [Bacteroidota bacterium]
MKNLDPSTTFIQVRLKPLKKETPPVASNTITQNPISETKTDTPILANTSSQKEILQGRDTVIIEKYKRDTVYFNLKTDEEIKKEEDLQKLLNEAQQKLTQMEAEIKQVKEREMQVKEQRELELRKQEEIQAALKKQPINEIDTKTGMLNQELFKLNNIVFLLDVSGSMIEGGKLILMQNNLKKLIQVLRPEDQISIITYNINAYETLPVTKVNNKFLINKTIDSLKASGLTNGVKGLEKAYQF